MLHKLIFTYLNWREKIADKLTMIRYRRQLLTCGTDCKIWKGAVIHDPELVSLGNRVGIGNNVVIWGSGNVKIMDDVLIAANSVITSAGHEVGNGKYNTTLLKKPIVLQNNVWIGAGVIVLPGVSVGENSIVAAGSVVNHDVPPNVIVAGIPAKVKKVIDSDNA